MKLDDAIKDFEYSQQLGSTNPGIYSGIGQAHRLLKNYKKSLQYLNDALKMSPEKEEFLIQRSNIYIDIQ